MYIVIELDEDGNRKWLTFDDNPNSIDMGTAFWLGSGNLNGNSIYNVDAGFINGSTNIEQTIHSSKAFGRQRHIYKVS